MGKDGFNVVTKPMSQVLPTASSTAVTTQNNNGDEEDEKGGELAVFIAEYSRMHQVRVCVWYMGYISL